MFRILDDDEGVTIHNRRFEGDDARKDVNGKSFVALFLVSSEEERLCPSFGCTTVGSVAYSVHAEADQLLSRVLQDFE